MKNKLRYDRPADAWEKGMALGNGRIGAMLLGETVKEHIWLNEDTLWSGYPTDYNDEKVYGHLEKARTLIFEKKYAEAEELINRRMVGIWNESYLPMSDLFLEMEELKGENESYSRELDISTGISTVKVSKNGISYERTAFCSYPDQVLVIRMKSSDQMQGTMDIGLSSQLNHWIEQLDNGIVLMGWCPSVVEPDYYPSRDPIIYEPYETTRAIKFQIRLKVITDGSIEWKQDRLTISETDEVLILLTSGNSFINYKEPPVGEYEDKNIDCINHAEKLGFQGLLNRHRKDFSSMFDRVELDLGHTENEALTMEERQKRFFAGEEDPEFAATAFQFGRYLMISSSREGSEPANLQGIWNHELRAPWSSNYTVNINTQMNYWPAENCNLTECAQPLISFMKDISESGAKTARINYHCGGWVAHHNVDLWRKTTAVGSRNGEVDTLPWSFWVMSGGWLCRHLWDHYLYTQDRIFLKDIALPIMKGASQFYLDWLVEHNGELVTNPSTSPENLFLDNGGVYGVSYACTLDNTILRELFENCIKGSDILNEEEVVLLKQIKEALLKIPPFKIGKYGQLQEWYEDFEENDPEHRHLSLLYGLYPSDQITVEKTPELIEACRITMKRRGEEGVPWSRAWKVGIFARLKDGENAYKEVKRFLQPADSNEISYTDGGVYYNLFCARPLEVDGNFGFTAGIAEMLVQNHLGKVEFLPAIPGEWRNGYVRGLKIRGNKEVEVEWKNGVIIKTKVTDSQYR
ncbi:glycosyl hydrolase family 95 catalytic domain-containing protein [Robinsoniella peoriensis]|uniref:glycoside hydrolase family 95 protein n=1 Tax=Robinsoniella peoriensis TaxID=180332 RepID=UPI000695027B|nr:glycoside hydrolase family 95 protein [Robinsoniella peoriensis]